MTFPYGYGQFHHHIVRMAPYSLMTWAIKIAKSIKIIRLNLWHKDCHLDPRMSTNRPDRAINKESAMKWMLGLILVLGGCSKLDYTLVSGDGAVIEQRHPLGESVTRVQAGVPANIHLVVGEERGILIRGQENLLSYVEITERDDKLELEVKDGYRFEHFEPIDITITLPRVTELALAGLARGDLSGFSGDELVLSVAGTGDIVASGLELNRLEGNIAGLGSLDLGTGSARAMELNIAGSGGVLGARLLSQEADVNIAGSGEVEVRVQERLKIEIAGSGSVSYWGEPELTSEIAGSGLVNRRGS